MGYTIGQVAPGFDVTPQTVRNWIKNPCLNEFFSAPARREDGRGQAELFASDVEVCNSIQVLLGEHLNWDQIAAKLRTGWRDTNLPEKFIMMDDNSGSPSNIMLMTKLAAAQEMIKADEKVEQMLRERVDELREALSKSDHEREEYLRQLVRAQVELELWQSGRLKREDGVGG